jgi:antitoxin ParD1/3/4
MVSMNVSVPEPMREWVQERIDSGHYATASDYVRDLIRRDQMQADERKTLVNALVRGEKSGISKRQIPEILEAVKQRLSNG